MKPVERWLQVERPDRCLQMVKDFPLVTADGGYHAVSVWSNGAAIYRSCLGDCSPPDEDDLMVFLGPRAISGGELAAYLESRDAAEVEAVFKLNRRWLFNLIHGDIAATGT